MRFSPNIRFVDKDGYKTIILTTRNFCLFTMLDGNKKSFDIHETVTIKKNPKGEGTKISILNHDNQDISYIVKESLEEVREKMLSVYEYEHLI